MAFVALAKTYIGTLIKDVEEKTFSPHGNSGANVDSNRNHGTFLNGRYEHQIFDNPMMVYQGSES